MVDPETYGKFLEAQEQAKQLGMSLMEVLDRRRLLVTQKRDHDIRVETLEDMLRRLSRQSPNKIMAYYYGRVDGTGMEMFSAVQMWLEAVVRHQANGTLGDL